ncbi:hypothetical protein E2C01_008304 [Portunus trituberculatus]|uniref:Uncharacterized protein n=1 Tax=Portunus trituberculatus TaxID=210409 RepID=A0A5B7D0E6_PORTR|nr:hypothetical protein [Portunus trituberculatus]
MQEYVILNWGMGKEDAREPLFTTMCVDVRLSDIFSSIKSNFCIRVLKSLSI